MNKITQPTCKNTNERIPLIYLFIFHKMVQRCGKKDIEVTFNLLSEMTRRVAYQLPKLYVMVILKELEYYGLIKKMSTRTYILYGRTNAHLIKKMNQYFLW